MGPEHIAYLPPHVLISLNPHKISYDVCIIIPIFQMGIRERVTSPSGSDEYKVRI